MPKEDAQLEGKRAELETLHRATAALLEKQEQLRAEFDIELAEKTIKAEKDIDKSLATKYKEFNKLSKDVAGYENTVRTLESKVSQLTAETDVLSAKQERDKAVIEGIVSELSTAKLSLNAELNVLKTEKTSVESSITTKQEALASLNTKIATASDEVSVLQLRIDDLTTDFEFKKTKYDKDEEDTNRRLSLINAQLDASSRSLHEVKSEEDDIRTDLADWQIRLDKREATIDGREAKVAQQEKRVFNYAKFTGL